MIRSETTPSTDSRLSTLPAEVAAALEQLRTELRAAAGENLTGLILYGSAARDRYRPGQSDVNVLVLLADVSCRALDALAPALRTAWRAYRIEPFVVTREELCRLTDVFPIKILEMQAHHLVLDGDDPFDELPISNEHLRLRTEQQLRNLLFRLRRRYLSIGGDRSELAEVLADSSRSLAVSLAMVARLAGQTLTETTQTAGALRTVGESLHLDGSVLERMAALRRTTEVPDDIASLYEAVLGNIRQAVDIVDRLEPSR